MSRVLLGLTGYRRVGKSTLASILSERHGYVRVHPADGMKAGVLAYLTRAGIPEAEACDMVYGEAKDVRHPRLPGPVRALMEQAGQAWGMAGPASGWTLGVELSRPEVIRAPKIVVESIVWEAPQLLGMGGLVARVTRPGVEAQGRESDVFVDTIEPHFTVHNDGDTRQLEEIADDLDQQAQGLADSPFRLTPEPTLWQAADVAAP